MNNYPFVVELSKNEKNNKIYNQILFCTCGNKQKTKLTIKRTLLKNTETLYEDKYSLNEIVCSNCSKKYDLLNNIYGLKSKNNLLVEVNFNIENIVLQENKLKSLKKDKIYYYFDEEQEELKSFILTDILIYDEKNKEFKLFSDDSLMAYNLIDSLSKLNSKKENSKLNTKQNKLKVFNYTEPNFINNFFDFDETINYKNLENSFFYFEELLKSSYEYKDLMEESFLKNFKISSKIYIEKDNEVEKFFVYQKDRFGSDGLVKKKLNTGDYINKLIKLSDITSIFLTFPPISTLYKTKGLDFILQGYNKQFFCSNLVLEYNNATNTNKILELCCREFYDSKRTIKFDSDKFDSEKTENNEVFKFSPLIVKNINETDDALVIYQFHLKKILTKAEIENIFLKFDSEEAIRVMSKIVTGANLRNTKLSIKHIFHILKNKLYLDNSEEWLNIYYDTINTLNLIVDILKNKETNKKNNKYINLSRISENKLFEIKSYDKLKELHDEMFAIYRAMEDENKDILFRQIVKDHKNLNFELNHFEFKVIPNLKELSQEGLVMKHCIYTYLNDIVKGNYLAIRVKDTISKEKATLGIKIEKDKLYVQQLKGYENSRPTHLLIHHVMEYCKQLDIVIESNHLHRSDIQPNVSLEKRMKNYISKEQAEKMRKKLSNKK
jgi:hypothetical protein